MEKIIEIIEISGSPNVFDPSRNWFKHVLDLTLNKLFWEACVTLFVFMSTIRSNVTHLLLSFLYFLDLIMK